MESDFLSLYKKSLIFNLNPRQVKPEISRLSRNAYSDYGCGVSSFLTEMKPKSQLNLTGHLIPSYDSIAKKILQPMRFSCGASPLNRSIEKDQCEVED